MALELAVQIIFILCPLLLYSPTSAQQTSLCDSKCGDVVISYPFYMNSSYDTSCFHNWSNLTEWFKIECRNNQKPFLMSINLEVTEIDIEDNTITVMNPIYNSCEYKSAQVDLRGSTFAYSYLRNKFVAFGCNKIALLSSGQSEVGGCASFCNKEEKDKDIKETPSRCLGQYCCETAPASYLIEYNVTIKPLSGNTDKQCGFAMIIDESSLYYNPSRKIETLGVVPAVLDWMMPITFKVPYNILGFCRNNSYNSSLGTPRRGYLCSCYYGGNPYIDGGCNEGRNGDLSVKYGRQKKSQAKWAIIGVFSSLGFISILIAVWWLCKIIKKRREKKLKEKHFQQNGGLLLQQKLSSSEVNVDKTKLFSSKDLEKATDRFNVDRVLGKGGQGTVYKGMLADGKIVAVKKLKVQGNVEDFINEVVILTQINHRNVVKLLGCCLETKFPLLVYEFIPNGTLFDHLHEQNDELPMTWDMRLRIAIEVAGALFYLHSAASQPIYHRDIKSTNILLDEKYKAKVADFGASRMVSTIDDTHVTTRVQGTFGYLDPEYYHTSQLTEKSDVYSFGVVLVELLTGQKAVSSLRSDGQAKSLASHFMISMDGNCLFDILDNRVLKEGDKEDIMVVAKLAKRCLNMTGKKRPTMREVAMELEGIQNLRKESNERQDHDEINPVKTDTYVPWEIEYSVSVDSLLNSMASSSSDVHPLMHSK